MAQGRNGGGGLNDSLDDNHGRIIINTSDPLMIEQALEEEDESARERANNIRLEDKIMNEMNPNPQELQPS